MKAIVITHAHIDHIGGAAKLKAATGAPVLMNAKDQELYDTWTCRRPGSAWRIRRRRRSTPRRAKACTLSLGDAAFQILETPGHTQGSVSVWIPSENKLVAGDTLFRDSIGRTDLPGGDGRQILRSIKNQLLPLPEDAIVIPDTVRIRPSGGRRIAIHFCRVYKHAANKADRHQSRACDLPKLNRLAARKLVLVTHISQRGLRYCNSRFLRWISVHHTGRSIPWHR